MRYGYLVLAVGLVGGLAAAPAQAGLLAPSSFDASHLLPPPPAPGSIQEQDEFKELKTIAARSTPEQVATALKDSKDEAPDMFNAALGFDITRYPVTTRLLQKLVEEEDVDTKAAKTFFHRERPYAADASIRTCAPVKPGKAPNSYPSGHASLAFSMGEILSALIPAKSQAILARAHDYSENRLVCGVHYRSDIVAGQQFGTVLALRLMELPAFQAQMDAARAELHAANLTN